MKSVYGVVHGIQKDVLATTSSDKVIKLWTRPNLNDIYKWKCIQTLDAHTRTVRCISWHPSEIYLPQHHLMGALVFGDEI